MLRILAPVDCYVEALPQFSTYIFGLCVIASDEASKVQICDLRCIYVLMLY